MSQRDLKLSWTKISKKDPAPGIYSIFENDNDFIENEDYYRDDTLSLGYDNEASRIVDEVMKSLKGKPITAKRIEEIIKNDLFGSSGYYESYIIEIVDEGDYFLVLFPFISKT